MREPTVIRVAVVDDDPIVRSGVRAMIETDPEIRVVGEAADGASAEAMIADVRPHVVLLDLRMPGQDGFTTAAHVTNALDPPYILVLTTFGEWEDVRRSLTAGAAGFLLKDTPPADFVTAIHKVSQGIPQFSPVVVRHLMESAVATGTPSPRAARAARLVAALSPRERSVAVSVAEGKTNGEIADHLHVSIATIKTHINVLLEKLEARNRVQVAVRVCEAGLL